MISCNTCAGEKVNLGNYTVAKNEEAQLGQNKDFTTPKRL